MASSDPNDHPINGDYPPLGRNNFPSGPLRRPATTSMNAVDEITVRTSELTVNPPTPSNGPSTGQFMFMTAELAFCWKS